MPAGAQSRILSPLGRFVHLSEGRRTVQVNDQSPLNRSSPLSSHLHTSLPGKHFYYI